MRKTFSNMPDGSFIKKSICHRHILNVVIPAKAGICFAFDADSRLRGNDSFWRGAFCAILLVISVFGTAQASDFTDANAKYGAGDYKAAAALYQKIAASKKATTAVYYNLGNALFRDQQKGPALVAYERAQRLDPRDKDVKWNKKVLRDSLTDRIEDAEENVFVSSVKRLLSYFSADEAALVFTGVLAFLFMFSLANFIFYKSKPFAGGLMGFFIFLCLFTGTVFYLKWLQVKDPRVVVLDAEVAVRYGPSEKETKAFTLHEGAQARVIDQTDSWYYIHLRNKSTGWIPKKSGEIV